MKGQKKRIRAIGFDFDGTLILSEEQKAKQMAAVFREKFGVKKGVESSYKILLDKGFNREQKVENIFEKFIKRKPGRKELKIVKSHFGQHYEKSMASCPLFRCTNLIKELKKQVDFLFLLSLEEKTEVLKIARRCGVAKYFDEILGGPNAKIKNFKHVLKKHKLKPSEVLYIGDAHSDVIASKKMGMKIILLGRKHIYEKLKEDLEADFVFSSLCNVPYGFNRLNSKD